MKQRRKKEKMMDLKATIKCKIKLKLRLKQKLRLSKIVVKIDLAFRRRTILIKILRQKKEVILWFLQSKKVWKRR